MSATKCSQCGLVNFLSADVCKRCKASLVAPSEPGVSPDVKEADASPMETSMETQSEGPRKITILPYEEPEVRRTFSPLRVLVLLLLMVGAAWLFYEKSEADRLAQLEKDKKFSQMRSNEEQNAERSRRAAEAARWSGPPSSRP